MYKVVLLALAAYKLGLTFWQHTMLYEKVVLLEHNSSNKAALDDAYITSQFEKFKTDFARKYTSPTEELKRKQAFADNLKFIHDHNARFDKKLESFEVGVNQFADLTLDGLEQYNGFRMPAAGAPRNGSTFLTPSNSNAAEPNEMDWIKRGYVTPVKNQNPCGSCWAFSANNHGCNGGTVEKAFAYIGLHDGINSEASYPYEAREGQCRYKPTNNAATLYGWNNVDSLDGNQEAALKSAVATVGPISVAIDAHHSSFQLYKGGLYVEKNCSQYRLTHAMLAVGYGKIKDKHKKHRHDYWHVKNSWDTNWGDGGYIWMARNQNNMCGIATHALYPLV